MIVIREKMFPRYSSRGLRGESAFKHTFDMSLTKIQASVAALMRAGWCVCGGEEAGLTVQSPPSSQAWEWYLFPDVTFDQVIGVS